LIQALVLVLCWGLSPTKQFLVIIPFASEKYRFRFPVQHIFESFPFKKNAGYCSFRFKWLFRFKRTQPGKGNIRHQTSDIRSLPSDWAGHLCLSPPRRLGRGAEGIDKIGQFFISASCSNEKKSRPCGEHPIHIHRLGEYEYQPSSPLPSLSPALLCVSRPA